MKKILRVTACALTLLVLVPIIVACGVPTGNNGPIGNDSTNGSSDVAEELGTDQYGQVVYDLSELKAQDFGEKEVIFAVREGAYQTEWFSEKPQSNIEQAIYARNLKIEDMLNVRITYNAVAGTNGTDMSKMSKLINSIGQAGDGSVDVIAYYAAYAADASLMPYYKDWLSSDLTWLNLDRNYWYQTFIDSAKAFDRLYFCVGDVNLSIYDRCSVVFFNQTLADQNQAIVGNLYETALNGDWTAEVMLGMVRDFGHTDSGTSEEGVYGLSSIKASEAFDPFIHAFNANLTQTNDDGTHTVVTDTAKNKLSDAFDKMYEFWYESGGASKLQENTATNTAFFTEGHSLFNIDILSHGTDHNNALKSMTDKFGVLPMPKYDTDQEKYYTNVQDAHNVISIMGIGNDNDFEAISAVLELLCAESYSSVRPMYIEETVKGQTLNDHQSGLCLDLVISGARWDFSQVYNVSTGGALVKLWRSPGQKSETGNVFNSSWMNNSSTINGKLATFDTWLATQY